MWCIYYRFQPIIPDNTELHCCWHLLGINTFSEDGRSEAKNRGGEIISQMKSANKGDVDAKDFLADLDIIGKIFSNMEICWVESL